MPPHESSAARIFGLFDDSFDTFGLVVTIACTTFGTALMKPDWTWTVCGVSTLLFVLVSKLVPGRRLQKNKD